MTYIKGQSKYKSKHLFMNCKLQFCFVSSKCGDIQKDRTKAIKTRLFISFITVASEGACQGNTLEHYYNNNIWTVTIGQKKATHHSCCLQSECNMKDREKIQRKKGEKKQQIVFSEVFSAVISDLLGLWTIRENTDKRYHSGLSCTGAPEYITRN